MPSLKWIAGLLCTCTWMEIMTGAGITLYMLYLQDYALAAITVVAFGPLIAFHFAADRTKPGLTGWEGQGKIKIRSISGKVVSKD